MGGKVAGCNPSIGVSNYGGIKVRISWFTLNFLYKETASGIKSVVNLKRFSSKSWVKSLGNSKGYSRQLLRPSANSLISGTYV